MILMMVKHEMTEDSKMLLVKNERRNKKQYMKKIRSKERKYLGVLVV